MSDAEDDLEIALAERDKLQSDLAEAVRLLERSREQINADHPYGTLYPYDIISRIEAFLDKHTKGKQQ